MANKKRVWVVEYKFNGMARFGYHMSAYPIGCVCDDWPTQHYHDDYSIKRYPDEIIRKPCDPDYNA